MTSKTFPVLKGKYLRCVPWEFVAPHEAQAQKNHSQTLKRLAERGGLSPHEMMCAMTGYDIWSKWEQDPEALLMQRLGRFIHTSVLQESENATPE